MSKGIRIHTNSEPIEKCNGCKWEFLCKQIRDDLRKDNPWGIRGANSSSAFRLYDALYGMLDEVGYWMAGGRKPNIENATTSFHAYACILQTIFGVDLNEIEGWYKND